MWRRIGLHSILLLLLVLSTAPLAHAAGVVGPIYSGPELDYQPAIIRVQPGGQLLVVFERLAQGTNIGDLYVTSSGDAGLSWSVPQPIISSSLNERHPALVQVASGAFVLFYLVNQVDGFRIHRATSSDSLSWVDQGAIDLGWSTTGEINPSVIREADGTLTMTYHRINGPSYIARSMDNGATWDTLQTQVSPGAAALPRIAKRESDGRYLVTYQVSSGIGEKIYGKVTSDPYNWNVKQNGVATTDNSHDSQPIVLENGTFVVFSAEQRGSAPFNLYYRTSQDGSRWSRRVRVTNDSLHYDTQPHPLLQGTPGHLILTWSHQVSSTPYQDHDVWINTDLVVQ